MERVFFSASEANGKVGKKVWVKINNLYDVKKGLPGTVIMAICLDQSTDGVGVRVDWKSTPSGSDAIMTVFTKNEYECYLNEEQGLDLRMTFD